MAKNKIDLEKRMSIKLDALARFAKKFAIEAERWAKANAKWQDQTGTARKLIKGVVFDGKTNPTVSLTKRGKGGAAEDAGTVTFEGKGSIGFGVCHRVTYGKWLETANNGKYAILEKAAHQYKAAFKQKIKEILEA